LNILVLGGTIFLGRALVEAARARGHRLTLFNRGKSAPSLYSDVDQVHGDRERDLNLLDRRKWDAVIDTCGYTPRVVRIAARRLAEKVGVYMFISSLSVYADTGKAGIDENGDIARMSDETVEEITGETYGPLKALCEREVTKEMHGQVLVIRPGLIVGPYDPTDRFTYWPWRIAQGGEVLAPARPQRPLQFIDVRDLAAWMVRGLELGLRGTYNACSPTAMCTMRTLLESCRSESNSQAAITWVDEKFLLREKVGPWVELPLWIPESDPESAGFYAFSSRKAFASGLVVRPLNETIRGVLDWLPLRGDKPWRAGFTKERERELLERFAEERRIVDEQTHF
jgi:2'-hydroxyisoflavone reductase